MVRLHVRMRPSFRLVPLAFAHLAACTVYSVPGDSESGSSGSTGDGTGIDLTSSSGEAPTSTGGPDLTTTSGSMTTTTVTTTTDPTDPSGPTSDPTTDPTGDPPADCDFPTSIQPIFNGCGCHNNDTPPKGLGLGEGVSLANLVDVDSVGQPGTPRVAPGDAAGSWLVIKLKPAPPDGTMQMPEGGMLPPDKVALIETWIDAGAPAASSFACDGEGGGGDEPGSVTIDEQGPVEVEIGETLDLDATVLDDQGNPVMGAAVIWRAAEETVVYVDGKGTLVGLGIGQTQVTAELEGVISDPITVNVTNNQAIAATPFADIRNMLQSSCGCHKGDMPPAALAFDLDDAALHAALLAPATQDGLSKRIVKDSPVQSYLFKKLTLTTPPTGDQMPKGNAPLDAEKVAPLYRWIINGAPE